MAGSYLHVTDTDWSFRGIDLIDNLGDAYEALQEMHAMIGYLAAEVSRDDPRRAIHEAHREGYGRRYCPPENVADDRLFGFEAYAALAERTPE